MTVAAANLERRIEFQRPSLSTVDLRKIALALAVDCTAQEKIEIARDCFSRAYEACQSRNWAVLVPIAQELSSLTNREGQT